MKAAVVGFVALFFCGTLLAEGCPKEEFQKKLKTIGFKDATSVVQAADELIKIAKGKPDKCKDELLSLFRDYHGDCREKYDEKIDPTNMKEKDRKNLYGKISPAGWMIKSSEGFFYIADASRWYESKFKEILSQAYNEYWSIRSPEISEEFSNDAIILISWQDISDRIIVWENFLKKHPDFVDKESIQAYLKLYVSIFLGGTGNSRIDEEWDQDGNENIKVLKPDVRKAYEKFIKNNPTSRYHKLIKDFYKMTEFTVPKDYEDYITDNGYESYLMATVPLY